MSEAVGVELREQFEDVAQQREAATLGMFCWLATELLLFAGLFVVALVLRVQHPRSVFAAAGHLKFWIGVTNTAVLILSSLTMSGAIEFSRQGWQRGMVRFMRATAALGGVFLILKAYEYWRDYAEHMMPFLAWRPYALAADPSSRLFTDTYYVTTLLHAVHLSTGVLLLLGLSVQAAATGYLSAHQNRIEIFGLYWHFIDLIWIIVFLVLYVLGR